MVRPIYLLCYTALYELYKLMLLSSLNQFLSPELTDEIRVTLSCYHFTDMQKIDKEHTDAFTFRLIFRTLIALEFCNGIHMARQTQGPLVARIFTLSKCIWSSFSRRIRSPIWFSKCSSKFKALSEGFTLPLKEKKHQIFSSYFLNRKNIYMKEIKKRIISTIFWKILF